MELRRAFHSCVTSLTQPYVAPTPNCWARAGDATPRANRRIVSLRARTSTGTSSGSVTRPAASSGARRVESPSEVHTEIAAETSGALRAAARALARVLFPSPVPRGLRPIARPRPRGGRVPALLGEPRAVLRHPVPIVRRTDAGRGRDPLRTLSPVASRLLRAARGGALPRHVARDPARVQVSGSRLPRRAPRRPDGVVGSSGRRAFPKWRRFRPAAEAAAGATTPPSCSPPPWPSGSDPALRAAPARNGPPDRTPERAAAVAPRAERARGLPGARARRGTVLLVDDVATSGATARECARALRRRGRPGRGGVVLRARLAGRRIRTPAGPRRERRSESLVTNLFHSLIVRTLPLVPRPIVRRIASRYVAGETLADALDVVRRLNAEGCLATLDVLGEDTSQPRDADATVAEYRRALDAIARDRRRLEHLGQADGARTEARSGAVPEQFARILDAASARGNFVRIDMEDSSVTEETIRIFLECRGAHRARRTRPPGVPAPQPRRTPARAAEVRANVRVCKGIYVEPPEIAYQGREEIRRQLLRAGRYACSRRAATSGSRRTTQFSWTAPWRRSRGSKLSPTRPTSSRCCSASRPTCGAASSPRAIACASTFPTGRSWYGLLGPPPEGESVDRGARPQGPLHGRRGYGDSVARPSHVAPPGNVPFDNGGSYTPRGPWVRL